MQVGLYKLHFLIEPLSHSCNNMWLFWKSKAFEKRQFEETWYIAAFKLFRRSFEGLFIMEKQEGQKS